MNVGRSTLGVERSGPHVMASHEPWRLRAQPFVAGATKGCGSRFMVPMRGRKAVGASHEPPRTADFPVGRLAGWKTGATGTRRFMVPMRDKTLVIRLPRNHSRASRSCLGKCSRWPPPSALKSISPQRRSRKNEPSGKGCGCRMVRAKSARCSSRRSPAGKTPRRDSPL